MKYNNLMSINYEKFSRLLPCKDSSPSKRQRDDMWSKWDTNANGFLSLREIEAEFLELFNLSPSDEITEIIKQCSDDAKNQCDFVGKLGRNHL